MNLYIILAVFTGGGVGALCRFLISLGVVNQLKSFLPVATLLANIIACAIMGITVLYAQNKFDTTPWLKAFILVGFCGGLSTFSTFSYETVLLFKANQWYYALGNIFISTALGILILYPFLKTTPTS